MAQYLITIIMPTYNSERTIEQSLKSIRNQTLDSEQIEIMIVDGGSTDRTITIALKYGAKIISNPKKLPEFAKQIGLLEAQGKYGVFIDSDEYFENMDSLKRRVQILERYSMIKNLVSTGQKCVEAEIGVSRYANYIGDPFSNFVYRYNGYDRTEDLKKQYAYQEEKEAYLFDFRSCDYLPLFDALGNMFDIEAARKMYREQGENQSFAANIFSNMVNETNQAVMLKNDYIYHQPGLSASSYRSKLKWRVKNNLFQTEGVGFSERNRKEIGLTKRKMLFIPYCAFVIPVVVDAARMVRKNRDRYFWNHILYTEYTFLTIVWYVFLKAIRFPVKMDKVYGKK